MKRLLSALLIVVCILNISLVPVSAVLGALPHLFWGTVTINGAPAPIGTKIEARGSGVIAGDDNPLLTVVDGYYGGQSAFSGIKLNVQGDIADASVLTFYINDTVVTTPEPVLWHSNLVTQLDLALTTIPPTTPPVTTPPPTTPPPTTPPTTTPPPVTTPAGGGVGGGGGGGATTTPTPSATNTIPAPTTATTPTVTTSQPSDTQNNEKEVKLSGLSGDIILRVDSRSGKTLNRATLNASTAGQSVKLDISQATTMQTADGNAITSISVNVPPVTPPLPVNKSLIAIQDFGPDGARFDPPITLTMSYLPANLPAGVSENDLVMAFWDGVQWLALDTVVDSQNKMLTAKISHFTIFGIIGSQPKSSPIPAATSPALTTTTAPAGPAETTRAPETPTKSNGPNWSLITLVTGVIAVALVLVAVLSRRRRTLR